MRLVNKLLPLGTSPVSSYEKELETRSEYLGWRESDLRTRDDLYRIIKESEHLHVEMKPLKWGLSTHEGLAM